jgi:protein ImuB
MSHRSLVVYCPNWPIVAARADDASVSPALPLALSHGHYITACCELASAQGVRPGQRVREAQGGCPELQLLPDRPERDQRVFERVLTHLSDTLALVAVIEPGVLAARALGLARYYGSEQAAAAALRQAIEHSPVPVSARVGIADSLFAAEQAAKLGTSLSEPVCAVEPGADRDFLSPLPVSIFNDSHFASLLGRLGVTTVGQFATLPSDQVRDRFGPPGLLAHRCATGEDASQTHQQGIPPGTDVVWRSDEAISQSDALSFALLAPAHEFVNGLIAAHTVCTTVGIDLVDERGTHYRRSWSHPRYFTANDLVNRVRWQWEAVATPETEEHIHNGIVEVTFQAVDPDDITWHEPGLWGATTHNRVEHVVAQLQTRLGYHAVSKADARSGHSWADTEGVTTWGEKNKASEGDAVAPWPGAMPKPLPATVFQPPVPISVTDDAGSGVVVTETELSAPPAMLATAQSAKTVTAWAGPWPVDERWWDERGSRRYRLQLLDSDGVGWLVSSEHPTQAWVVEARYD